MCYSYKGDMLWSYLRLTVTYVQAKIIVHWIGIRAVWWLLQWAVEVE